MQGGIRPGYKQTEVGLIPEDWETRHLWQELDGLEAGVSVNSVDEKLQFAPDDVYILKTSAVSDGAFFASEIKKVAQRDLKRVKTHARADSIILSRMNTPDLVGESGYVERDYPNFFLPDRLWMTRFKRDSEICVRWLSYLLTSQRYKVIVKSAATGTSGTMKNISKGAFTSILLPWPQPDEQRAIAAALADADALIAALEGMIAKKRDLKQAAMQHLLTGKTRLPGFSGEWGVRTLLEVCGGRKELFDDGDWIEAEHITNKGIRLVQTGNIGVGQFLEKDERKYIFEASFVSLRCKEIVQGDLLICRLAEPAGRACVLPEIGEGKIVTSVDVTIARPNAESANRTFLANLMSTPDWFRAVSDKSGGTTHKRIARGALGKISLFLPPVVEQTAIAEVLSDMDADLAVLEAQVAKARAVKQGMMQELLTGRVRLV